MTKESINQKYFQWLYDFVCRGKRYRRASYKKLLTLLHTSDFYYILPRDANRYEDGIQLRYRFGCENDIPDYVVAKFLDDRPCSVLEMMAALCLRCAESITSSSDGDRASELFIEMITSMGLGGMSDSRFHKRAAQQAVTRLLERNYERDGTGGLFTVPSCSKDLRSVEIWYQMMFYLDETEL